MNKPTRPLIALAVSMLAGIIGGRYYLEKQWISFLFCLLISSLLLGIYSICYKQMALVLVLMLIGSFNHMVHIPVTANENWLASQKQITFEGEVTAVKENSYYKVLTVKKAVLQSQQRRLKQPAIVCSILASQSIEVKPGDKVEGSGTPKIQQDKMNPSDVDYKIYQRAKNNIGTLKAEELTVTAGKLPVKEKVKQRIEQQINKLFDGQDDGIVKALILGDDDALKNETYDLYTATGIGHVLALSGFHISLVLKLILLGGMILGLSYVPVRLLTIGLLWVYVYFTGAALSTVRAGIMASLMLGARCLWEEEDVLSSLSLAAMLILWHTPYALFTAGFQLSFGAIIGITGAMTYKAYREEQGKETVNIIFKYLCPFLGVQLVLWPIMAYHFYVVPVVGSIINLVVMPLFSLIMILSLSGLLISFVCFEIGLLIAKSILVLLWVVQYLCKWALHLPLSIAYIGRPSLIAIGLYGCLVAAVIYMLLKETERKYFLHLAAGLSTYVLAGMVMPQHLKIDMLYVGQGDSTIVQLPKGQILLVDGGPEGQGSVIQNYLYYKGEHVIDWAFLSHSDSDHLSGLKELVEMDFPIKHVVISQADKTEEVKAFIKICEAKQIPVYEMGEGENLTWSEVSLQALYPGNDSAENNNNNSLVFKLKYKDFDMLFTGDVEKEYLPLTDEPLSVLKISHHGSRTGTSQEMLLKLRPQYAMMSCGIDNRYGHPHEEVISLLENQKIDYGRTDLEGALFIETNGKQMDCTSYKEEGK